MKRVQSHRDHFHDTYFRELCKILIRKEKGRNIHKYLQIILSYDKDNILPRLESNPRSPSQLSEALLATPAATTKGNRSSYI